MNLIFDYQRIFDIAFGQDFYPFGLAAILIIALGILEAIGVLIAIGPGHLLDIIIPDSFGDSLSFLHVGKVPAIILAILFLAGFSVGGFVSQFFWMHWCGQYLQLSYACIVGALTGFLSVYKAGGFFEKIVGNSKSTVVDKEYFIGQVGFLAYGIAKRNHPAEIKVRDIHGQRHYLMVEPQDDLVTINPGINVKVVGKKDAVFLVVAI